MREDIKTFIEEGTKEFIDKDYFVTIEMSLASDSIDETLDWVDNNVTLPKDVAWMASECETCEEYHGKGYVHFSIEADDSYKTVTTMKNSSNFIRLSYGRLKENT